MKRFPLRFTLISIASLALAAAIGWKFFAHKTKGRTAVAPDTAPTTASTPVATARPPSLPPAGPDVSLPPVSRQGTNDFSMLKDASREEILALAQDMLARDRPLEDIISLLDYLAASKPEFALDLARDIGRTDDERHVLLLAVLDDWAHADPATALQWAFQKSGKYNLQGNASLLYVVLEQVTADDPQAALTAAGNALREPSGSLSGTNANEVARLTVEALAKAGRTDLAQQAIENWLQGPEAANLDGATLEVVAMSLAQNSLGDSADWLQLLPVSPARNQALSTIETVWMQSDPAAAINWAQGLPESDGRDDTMVSLFGRWLAQDRAAAMKWLSQHEASPARNRLISASLADPKAASSPP
jgi:hypothetical protein